VWVSVGASTNQIPFIVVLGYTCILNPAPNTCPDSVALKHFTPVNGSLAWEGYIGMPAIPGCSAYVGLQPLVNTTRNGFNLQVDICNGNTPIRPDWPELDSANRFLFSDSWMIKPDNSQCFGYPSAMRFSNTTYSVDVRSAQR
jgi:hypothetical protein